MKPENITSGLILSFSLVGLFTSGLIVWNALEKLWRLLT